MIINSLKNNGRYIFKQKRFNFDLISSKENCYDVIPFNFNEIDKMVQIIKNHSHKPENKGNSYDKLIYELVNQTKYIMYYSISPKNKSLRYRNTDSSGQTNIIAEYHKEHEVLCQKLSKFLPFMNKDDLLSVLSRSTPAHYYTQYKCWYVLSKIAARQIFSTKEKLSCQDIVMLLISFSKWQLPGLSEFTKKLDWQIVINTDWTLDSSSNVLWSLFLLKLYPNKSSNYLNGLLTHLLDTRNDLHFENKFSDNIHKISKVNFDSIVSLCTLHPLTFSIVNYFQRNPLALKCLEPKALVSFTNILRYSKYNNSLITNLVNLIIDSIHNFSSSEITEIFYTFSIIEDSLSKEAQNLVISLLFKFRDSVFTSGITLIPKEVAIILYTNRIFLNNVDLKFTSKCFVDILANLHLLGSFSTIGNLLCLNQILIDFPDKLDYHHRQWIKDTFKLLSNIANPEPLVDDIEKGVIDSNKEEKKLTIQINHSLWHMSAMRNLGIQFDFILKCNEFLENYKKSNHGPSIKELVLFLANSFGNRELMDYYYRNMVLLICTRMYPKRREREIFLGHWSLIECYLVCFNIFKEFKRELKSKINISTEFHSSQLLSLLSSIFGKRSFEDSLQVIEKLASTPDREIGNDEIMIVKFFMIQQLSNTDKELAMMIFNEFYLPNIHLGKLNIKGSENAVKYITKCLYSSCSAISTDILYTKLFFLQNEHKKFSKILPSIVIGEAFKTKTNEHNIYKIGEWLKREKNWDCLSKFLKNYQNYCNKEEREFDKKEEVEIKHIYTNWKIEEMEINYILENNYVGPWLCPYALKNKDSKQTLLIFPIDHKFNNDLHIFDKIKRENLSKFGYNFMEIFYE